MPHETGSWYQSDSTENVLQCMSHVPRIEIEMITTEFEQTDRQNDGQTS